jgi:hypothetical protein
MKPKIGKKLFSFKLKLMDNFGAKEMLFTLFSSGVMMLSVSKIIDTFIPPSYVSIHRNNIIVEETGAFAIEGGMYFSGLYIFSGLLRNAINNS